MEDNIDLVTGAQSVTPDEAPVSDPEPLTGKEKAGISLTWGIIVVLVLFLIIILAIFVWGEARFLTALDQLQAASSSASPGKLTELAELLTALESKQTAFRTFWFDTLQLILLNVLFPTLTALLGYVFGTSRNNHGSSPDPS